VTSIAEKYCHQKSTKHDQLCAFFVASVAATLVAEKPFVTATLVAKISKKPFQNKK
jgi:hypothetical protein